MEMTKDESKRILRRIELEAYSALVTALRAQGELDREKKRLLRELGEQLSISTERHRAEIRRAISDDRLSMIAECVCGSDASVEWESEGRRVIPLMPRLVPQTAFTGAATAAANHAASVNSTISTSVRVRTREHDDDDMKSKKRQRTTSPKPVQKVIVSSVPKTTTPKDLVSTATSVGRSTNVTLEAPRLIKTTSLSVKQENTNNPMSSVLMKISSTHSGSSSHSSKPIILGGSKHASSVSVATSSSKHIVPLPASCLQAHASVVSSNKNRAKLNLIKQKPKPKFKPVTAAVKVNTAPSVSPVSSVSQFPKSTEKNKALEISTPVGKTIQIPRNTSSLTVSPRSSISLTTFKSTLEQKSKSQSPPGLVRTVESATRHASGQLAKAASVSRLPRPLPAILPKTLPPKTLSSIVAAGRKLASILPAPVKSTVSNPVLLPVATNTSTASSPIPIAPLPRPPQSFHGLTAAVLSKVPAVSLTTGPSTAVKRENRETCSTSSTSEVIVSSAAAFDIPEVGFRNSSPSLLSKSQEGVHERETLSPVSDILTLVTSPSSVPFVSSSPLKSKPRTTGAVINEISLKCDEKLSEVKDFLKKEDVELSSLSGVCQASTTHFLKQGVLEEEAKQNRKNSAAKGVVQTLNDPVDNTLDPSQASSVKAESTDLFQVESSTVAIHSSEQSSRNVHKENELVHSCIDISPLVNELLSNSSVVVRGKDVEKTVDIPNPQTSDTADPDNISKATAKDVGRCSDVDLSIDVQKHEQENNFVQNPAVILETNNQSNVINDVDIVDASVNTLEDETSTMKDVIEDRTTKKIMMQIEDTVEPNNEGKLTGELLVTENENRAQHEEISDMKEKDEANEINVEATDIGKSEEGNLPTDTKKSVEIDVSEERGMVEASPSEHLMEPEQSEKVEGLDKRSSLDYQKESDQLIVTAVQNVENVNKRSPLKESGQSTALITEHVVKLSESSILENKTVTEHLVITTKIEQPMEDSLITDEKDNDQLSVKPMKNLPLLDEASEETKDEKESSIVSKTSTQSLFSNLATESQEIDDKLESPSKTGSRHDSNEEQFSGSDTGSTEGGLIRTSGRKRKAPPPRDLSLSPHPPGWIRGALLLLQRVSRFRGNARVKGEPSAASWFIKPVEAADAPGYHKIIKTPMDFGTIKSKLEASEYSDHSHFHADMLLVKTNCYKYNPPGHDVRRDCDEVFQFFEAEYEKFAEKLEKCHLSSAKKARPLSSGNESK